MFKTITETFPYATVAMVVLDKDVEYLNQYALWRRAEAVIGVHGGSLGGAVFLSPGQMLIEGFFTCHNNPIPTMFGTIAVSNAAAYRCAQCYSGGQDGMKYGCNIHIDEVISALREIF